MSIFRNCMRLCRVSTVAALIAAGCSSSEQPSTEPTESTSVESLAAGLQKLNSDLVIGSSGDDVRTVHEYFKVYGYFPSSSLTDEHPYWQPVVSQDPAFDDVFDERTEQAVLHLQYQAGIEQTGYVDAATRDALRLKRESALDRIDDLVANQVVEKFSFQGGTVTGPTNITFKFDANVSLLRRHEIKDALQTWVKETNLRFTEVVNGGAATIVFKFQALGVTGSYTATTPAFGSDVTFDSNDAFTNADDPPATPGVFDMETVALQAVGRTLGLGYSSISGAVMHTTLTPGTKVLSLTPDDKVAISALYETWIPRLPAVANDVALVSTLGAVGGHVDTAWAIGDEIVPGQFGFTVHRWNGSSWVDEPGISGVRIAGGLNSGPWVVRTDGKVYERVGNNWTNRGHCAKDVALGSSGSVWAVGCDGRVSKWSTGTTWTPASGNLLNADRIAVTSAGIPWIVNDVGAVFTRSVATASPGSWAQNQGACAKDVGAADHVWAIGCNSEPGGFGTALWNAQDALGNAPAKREWKFVPGGAMQIAVGKNGPWAINNIKQPFQFTKAP